jgi:hypothetical protein
MSDVQFSSSIGFASSTPEPLTSLPVSDDYFSHNHLLMTFSKQKVRSFVSNLVSLVSIDSCAPLIVLPCLASVYCRFFDVHHPLPTCLISRIV